MNRQADVTSIPRVAGLSVSESFEPIVTEDQEIRLATTEEEVVAAQRLRYRVFYDECGAKPTPQMAFERRDFDAMDDYCDHLLVIDRRRGSGAAGVVATYRLLRRGAAARAGRFYSAAEYDIAPILAEGGEILELGRSCVDAEYRNKMTMQLLWKGLYSYVSHHDIDLMFGCASLSGNDPDALAVQLSYLYHNHLAPDYICPRALPDLYVDMNRIPAGELDMRRALATLPPLIKGYLRVGGYVGNGAVIDRQFNTTDVCVIVRAEDISGRYSRHYGRGEDGRPGAGAS